jgi:hypothetical protein
LADRNGADAEVDWKYMAWTQSLAAGRAWDSGYAAAKEQYGGFGIDIDKMAGAMYEAATTADARPWEAIVQDAVLDNFWAGIVNDMRVVARAALDYIEKQADA